MHLQAGTPYTRWPAQDRAQVPPGDAAAYLGDEGRQALAGAGVVRADTDIPLYAALLQEGATQLDRLLDRPLSSYLGALQEPEHSQILGLRADARAGGLRSERQIAAEKVLSLSRELLDQIGVDPTLDAGPGRSPERAAADQAAFAALQSSDITATNMVSWRDDSAIVEIDYRARADDPGHWVARLMVNNPGFDKVRSVELYMYADAILN